MHAKAKVKVTEAEERKAAALLAYTQVTAPYDGVVTVRNANTGDYVQAVTGDKSTVNPSAIFVVEHADILRIFVDVPERYAAYVEPGQDQGRRAGRGPQRPRDPRHRHAHLLGDTRKDPHPVDGNRSHEEGVRRPAAGDVRLRHGVHPSAQRLRPAGAGAHRAGQPNVLFPGEGRQGRQDARRYGAVSDGKWVEVDKMKIDDPWVKVTGKEQVIVGDLGELTDGEAVSVSQVAGQRRVVMAMTIVSGVRKRPSLRGRRQRIVAITPRLAGIPPEGGVTDVPPEMSSATLPLMTVVPLVPQMPSLRDRW